MAYLFIYPQRLRRFGYLCQAGGTLTESDYREVENLSARCIRINQYGIYEELTPDGTWAEVPFGPT
jgi:hypothetical protein